MRKYKLLQFGKCYVNKNRDMVVALLSGSKKKGYKFAGSTSNPYMLLGTFYLLSRIVDNDGNWTEINPTAFNAASTWHAKGQPLPVLFQ